MKLIVPLLFLLAHAATAQTSEISSFSPNSGSTRGSTIVFLNSNLNSFDCVSRVRFGDATARFLSMTGNYLLAIAPPQPPGPVALTVETCRGVTMVAREPYTYVDDASNEFERILIPVYRYKPFDGAMGSRWSTRFTVVNGADEPVQVYGYDYGCRIGGCGPEPPMPPGIEFSPAVLGRWTDFLPARFIYVERSNLHLLSMALTIEQLNGDDPEKERLPIVRESDWFVDKKSFVGLQLSPSVRFNLRLYDRSQQPNRIRVKIYATRPRMTAYLDFSDPGDVVLSEMDVPLFAPPAYELFYYPAYAEIPDLVRDLSMQRIGGIRIEVAPTIPGQRFWALLTVTDNQTNAVQVITAQ